MYDPINFRKSLCSNKNCKFILVCPYLHPNTHKHGDKLYSNSIMNYYSSYIKDVKNIYKRMFKSLKKELEGQICIKCKIVINFYHILSCEHIYCEDCFPTIDSCLCGNNDIKKVSKYKLI